MGEADTVARPGKRRKGAVIEGERHRKKIRRETVRKKKTGRAQEESGEKREKGWELQKEVGVLYMGQGCCTNVPLEEESLNQPVISCLVGLGRADSWLEGW